MSYLHTLSSSMCQLENNVILHQKETKKTHKVTARWILQHLQLILVPRVPTKNSKACLIYLDLKGITEIESATHTALGG